MCAWGKFHLQKFSPLKSQTAFLLCSVGLICDTLTHTVLFLLGPSFVPFQFSLCFLNPSLPGIFFLMIHVTYFFEKKKSFSPLFDSFTHEWICFSCSHRTPFISSITHFDPFRLLSKPLTIGILSHAFHPPLFFFNLTSFSVSLTFSVAAPLAAPSCEGLLLQDNAVSAEIRALLSSYYNDRWSNKN